MDKPVTFYVWSSDEDCYIPKELTEKERLDRVVKIKLDLVEVDNNCYEPEHIREMLLDQLDALDPIWGWKDGEVEEPLNRIERLTEKEKN